MIVKCIDDDWSTVPVNSVARLVLKVGDPMPEKGKEYEVIGFSHSDKYGEGYELAGLDYSNYPGGRLLFRRSRFEVVDNSFVPNHVIQDGPMKGSLVREVNFYAMFTYNIPKPGKLPRKKKKKWKKEMSKTYIYTHPDTKLRKP